MSEQEIYSKFQSHWDDDNDWIPGETGSGQDAHNFSAPAGKQYTRYDLRIEANTMGSSASTASAPQYGATGNQSIKIDWHYNPFGKIAYTLRVYADDPSSPPPQIDVWINSANWVQQCFDAIRQRQKIRILHRGPEATNIVNILRRAKRLLPLGPTDATWSMDYALGWDDVVAIAVLCSAAVAVVALLVILLICLYATNQRYKVWIKWSRKGPLPFDDTLEIGLDPT